MGRIRTIRRRGGTIVRVTHHVDEIIPEIDRVSLLRRGRVAQDGPTATVLTSGYLSDVFGAPVVIEHLSGYYRVHIEDAQSANPCA